MTPVDILVSRFGGVRALARLVKKDPSTIHRWKMPAAKGGMDGRVPSSMQTRMLELAKDHGVELTALDLVAGSDGRAVSCMALPESSGAAESVKSEGAGA